ncbi:DUF402 domain-containing protein [Paenibacillus thermoaerophilus]|uniref:DUF402 domain-containing protein n=1 Tax=Paenibacillus thermoaerophilus TaxID=1215385 RepID=A0ABW2V1S6_9BACL|nr:DUF402 domain-containing protein [Paenibacillus thermoaerophilus]TMV18266.1 DUF402 domain-containing protein [Paenibacillus thermoaerophilus]
MSGMTPIVIKSFKHNGHLHRMWLENWQLPPEALSESIVNACAAVLVNCQTRIVEADGHEWVSRIPSVVFFPRGEWFNVVALLEDTGTRFYCNIASPAYVSEGVITYIDYDLDVIVAADGSVQVVDQDEYERHKRIYHYHPEVERKVQAGLDSLMRRIELQQAPFREPEVRAAYRWWLDNRKPDEPAP